MGAHGANNWIIVGLALLWLGIAAWIALAGARRLRLAQQVLDAARANARMLELAPARPLLVRPDQHVAWRSDGASDDPRAALTRVLSAILNR